LPAFPAAQLGLLAHSRGPLDHPSACHREAHPAPPPPSAYPPQPARPSPGRPTPRARLSQPSRPRWRLPSRKPSAPPPLVLPVAHVAPPPPWAACMVGPARATPAQPARPSCALKPHGACSDAPERRQSPCSSSPTISLPQLLSLLPPRCTTPFFLSLMLATTPAPASRVPPCRTRPAVDGRRERTTGARSPAKLAPIIRAAIAACSSPPAWRPAASQRSWPASVAARS
jgi:hypothetical protein